MGDPDASVGTPSFDAIYQELREQVLALGYRMTGSREDAEDVLQETFLLVHRHIAGFRGESKVSTWVYRIAVRVALARRKRGANRGRVDLDSDRARDLPAPPEADRLRSMEELSRIQQALQSLSPQHSTVLSLLAVGGLSPAEVAEILGVPEGTVWSRASNARKQLRERLGRSTKTREAG